METVTAESSAAIRGCPMHALPAPVDGLQADDELVFPMHKSTVVHYATGDEGATELRLYYGDREISFDEPELFTFGETLARQERFPAGAAMAWAPSCDWPRIRELLEQLIEEGILVRAENAAVVSIRGGEANRPSPLPPAPQATPRTWDECEAITQELAGRGVDRAHLEMVIPIFRVAHMAMDAEGRQVGESNVFPKALRVEVPTRWRTCMYSGTRYQTERPMNVSALKSMRAHWPQMMRALLVVRAAYLRRFPEAAQGWTVGHLERLSTAVLAVPTYQLVREDGRVANGHLHPVLSSLFRVTDGLRMTMHQMLFVPIGEPTLAPDAPLTTNEILAYAERNHSFHSEHGVCAGPRAMIEEFLATIVDGRASDDLHEVVLDAPVQEALAAVEQAVDYAFYGLQVYAAVFSQWPVMTRTYETLATIAQDAPTGDSPQWAVWRARLDGHVQSMQSSTFLANERWRADRERVFADMYEQCNRGLGLATAPGTFATLTAPVDDGAEWRTTLHAALVQHFGDGGDALSRTADCIADHCLRARALLSVGAEAQADINRLLGRDAPKRPFCAADVDVHNLLQGAEARHLPYLFDEIETVFGLRIHVDHQYIAVTHSAGNLPQGAARDSEFGRHSADRSACEGHASIRGTP